MLEKANPYTDGTSYGLLFVCLCVFFGGGGGGGGVSASGLQFV